jgi:hypothetical protein
MLGKNTAKRLGMLKVRLHINQDPVSEVEAGFPRVSRGLGKLKSFQVKILINAFVKQLM